MSVLLYKGAKYRTLAGKKIFHNGEWIELPASAKMYLNGQWYPLGRTVPGSSIPDITVIQPAPSMSLDVETGQVTAEYTPVAGLVEDTSKKSSTLQLETLAGQTITPGSSAQTIAGGKFLTGDIVVSAVDSSGEVSDEGLTAGLLCVSKYEPAHTKINALTLSGLYNDSDNSGYDLTPANGTYTVTADTASKDSQERIYKHATENYYVYYIPPSEDDSYFGYGWALNTSIDLNPAIVLMYTQAQNLQEGTKSWYGEMNMLAMPVTLAFTSTTQIAADIRGHFVRRLIVWKGGDFSTRQYSLYYQKRNNTEVEIISCDYEPEIHGIYAVTHLPKTIEDSGEAIDGGYHLSGKPVANEGGEHLLMYVPWNNGYDDPLIRIYNPRGSENYLCANAWKFPTMYPGSGSSEYHNNHVATEAPAGGHALWLAGTDFDRYEITTTHGGTAPSGIDRIGKFTSLPWDADRYWSVTMMFSTCVQEGTPRIRPMRVISGSQLIRVDVLPNSKDNGFYDLIVYNNDNPIITLPEAIHWERAEVDEFGVSHPKYYAYFCALTYDFDAKTLKIYLSGPYVQKSEDPFWIIGVEELPAAGEYTNLTFGPTSENVFNTFQFGIGHQNSDYVLGYYSEIKVWDIPLTPLQVGAELHRIITLEEEE